MRDSVLQSVQTIRISLATAGTFCSNNAGCRTTVERSSGGSTENKRNQTNLAVVFTPTTKSRTASRHSKPPPASLQSDLIWRCAGRKTAGGSGRSVALNAASPRATTVHEVSRRQQGRAECGWVQPKPLPDSVDKSWRANCRVLRSNSWVRRFVSLIDGLDVRLFTA